MTRTYTVDIGPLVLLFIGAFLIGFDVAQHGVYFSTWIISLGWAAAYAIVNKKKENS